MTGSPFDQMTAALAAAFVRIMGLLVEFWTGAAGTSSSVASARISADLAPYSASLTVTTATIGVVIAGTRMAVASSRAYEPARDLVRGLLVLTAVWWGGAFLLGTLSDGADTAARHVLASAGVGDTGAGGLESALTPLAITDPGLAFLLCLVGALSGLVQFLLLLMREPALALLAGALPVAAGASLAGVGAVHLKRLLAWTIALTGYPFVTAVIYAAGVAALGTAGDLRGVIGAVALVVAAVAALPVMVRLIAPAVEASLSGSGTVAPAAAGPAPGALVLSGRGRQTVATGPPSDAGPHVRPGLVTPTGSRTALMAAAQRRSLTTSAPPGPARSAERAGGPDQQDATTGSGGTGSGSTGSGSARQEDR